MFQHLLSNKFRIREYQVYPSTPNTTTKWAVECKLFGLFWVSCVRDYQGGYGDLEFWDDFPTIERARRSLIEKIGIAKLDALTKEGKFEITTIPELRYGHRILCDYLTEGRGKIGYKLTYGYYDQKEHLKIFVGCKDKTDIHKDINELLMKVQLMGLDIDNLEIVKNIQPKNLNYWDVNEGYFIVG